MKFLTTVELGKDGFKGEERASMRYIPSGLGSRLSMKFEKKRSSLDGPTQSAAKQTES